MLDYYLWGKCERISPEAPVGVVDIEKESVNLGGAGNVINNLISLGSGVVVASVIGDDEVGDEIYTFLNGVSELCLIRESGRKSSKKSRIIASHQQVIRFDKESKTQILKVSEDKLLEFIESKIDDIDVVLVSDYGKGVLTFDLTQNIINLSNKSGKKVLIDPKGSDYSKYKNSYLITPNKKEAGVATNINITNEDSLKEAGFKLKNELNLKYSLITLSEDGIAIFDDSFHQIKAVAKEVFDVTGAGDTVLASLGFAIAQDVSIFRSVEFANSAAAVVVSKIGSATVTLEEIAEYEKSLHKNRLENKIKNWEEIALVVEDLKKLNKKIVFTNGCFDILHVGHVSYLQTAKSFGDILILGLNSDNSIKRIKGESRPINSQMDRAIILSALEMVDFVVIFDEDTPYELISLIKPDILVKGGDYEGKVVVGSNIAKETKLVSFVDGKSTTNVINSIILNTKC